MLRRTQENLSQGNSVIYDDTNLNKRKRMNTLRCLKDITCEKKCILFATELDLCLEYNNKRNTNRRVPAEKIVKFYTGFQPPHKSEGWDDITIIANYNEEHYGMDDHLFRKMSNFDQKNTHHKFNLYKHCRLTYKIINVVSDDWRLADAALFHDIGKLKTQSIDDSGEAHYYGHHNVSAYEAALYLINIISDELEEETYNILETINLIYYHMHPYMSWSRSEKSMRRDKKLLGDEFFNKVMTLHYADILAH
jgi:hypothetical protein